MMHYGHANAFRLGRELGTTLVVGVNSSETIEVAKRAPPLMTDEERCASVRACKFVDEVIEKTPYVMTREYLDWVIKTYDIDYVVYGDDPCYVDGVDVYGHVEGKRYVSLDSQDRGCVYLRDHRSDAFDDKFSSSA